MPWVFLTIPGNFILAALLTQYYGLDKTNYGLIVSLPAWSNALQIAVLPLLARFLTPKDLTLGMGWLNIVLWSMLALVLPYLPQADTPGIARLFVVFFAVSSLSHAFLSVGWTSWVREWVPSRVRGQYFGQRNRWLNLSTVVYLLLALGLFEMAEHDLWPFQVLIGTAVLMRYASLTWQTSIRTTSDHLDVLPRGWHRQLRRSLAEPGLAVFIAFATWTSFWLGFVGPFIPVFSFEELRLEPGAFTIFVILGTMSGIFGWWFWGRLLDRHGCLPVLAISLGVWELQGFLWIVLTPDNTWLLYPMWIIGGFFSTGYFAASFNLLLKLVAPGSKLAGVSLHLAVTSLAAAAAPIVAGALLTHFIAEGYGLVAYRTGFGIKGIAVLAGLLLLRHMTEPQRSTRTSLPGAFRTMRQILVNSGSVFLAAFTPQRARRTPRRGQE